MTPPRWMGAVEATCACGSPATTPLISPCVSCSAAASAAPAPFETLAAMTIVRPGWIVRVVPLEVCSPNFSLST